MRRAFVHTNIFIVLLFLLTVLLPAADRLTGREFTTRSEVIATHGMAATSQPLATGIALDIRN